MEAIEERIRQAAKEEARQEANKEVMTMVGSLLAAIQTGGGAMSVMNKADAAMETGTKSIFNLTVNLTVLSIAIIIPPHNLSLHIIPVRQEDWKVLSFLPFQLSCPQMHLLFPLFPDMDLPAYA